ncbi:MAG: AI-2E family transporter [Candidatus Dojkabacteria bacterium]|nr:MAG: AI-2E family transporter [Candidatus Dojkabacteria bacterium]
MKNLSMVNNNGKIDYKRDGAKASSRSRKSQKSKNSAEGVNNFINYVTKGHEVDPTTVVHKIEITWKSIAMVLITLGALYLGMRLLSLLSVFFLGFVFSAVLLPPVRKLMRRGIGKFWAIAITYLGLAVIVIALLIMVLAPLAQEISAISHSFPSMKEQLINDVSHIIAAVADVDPEQVAAALNEYGGRLIRGELILNSGGDRAAETFRTISDFGAVLGSLFLSVILSIYIISEHDTFLDIVFLRIMDENKRTLAKGMLRDVEDKLGRWLLGQGALSLIVGVSVWLILTVFGVPFALPLALLAAMAELIPSGGAVISFIPAVVVALVSNGVANALMVAGAYIVFYQIENAILVPKIMGNVIGVKPIVVFVGLLVGLSIGGITGAIMAVPAMVLIKIGYDFYVNYQKLKAEGKI